MPGSSVLFKVSEYYAAEKQVRCFDMGRLNDTNIVVVPCPNLIPYDDGSVYAGRKGVMKMMLCRLIVLQVEDVCVLFYLRDDYLTSFSLFFCQSDQMVDRQKWASYMVQQGNEIHISA